MIGLDSNSAADVRSMYHCNCVDGKCIGCGECCSDILPVTSREIKRLKQYVKKHHLKEHRHNFLIDVKDCTCPFRNELTKKCDVYEVRPEICRSFFCTKSLPDAERDRDLLSQRRDPRSMRYEIFGNDENMQLLIEAKMMLAMYQT